MTRSPRSLPGGAAAAIAAFVFGGAAVLAGALAPSPAAAQQQQQLAPVVPPDQRGRLDAERSGTHDAANIRTVFWNYGMVGDYPPDPGNVDLSVFHSVEVPKGTGMNYCDGITPFVLAKIKQTDGTDAYIMETGFRERQGLSPLHNRVMRLEPRPGFFEPDPGINRGRSPAISNDPRTWPHTWPDKSGDPDDPGWSGSWDGYFGKRPAADQESYTVMDDDYYDAWRFYPDSRDSSRHGLGLRVEVRGFQWANPQARNVIFWHYDITNEGTTDYDDNIIFGLYMDAGVGGSALSCDGVYESDDDNAFFDKSSGLNLVYTWDRFGHGVDLRGNCSPTGYLGYAYLETPGNPEDGIDNNNNGIIDERRDGGPGQLIRGKDAIRAYVYAHYDMQKFQDTFGPLENRPAYKRAYWWTGDEDMDWDVEFDDVGADGVAGTRDTGEGDSIPTEGEPNFDRTDVHESDQIGLTGFKMNRIKAGQGNPDPTADDILFFTNNQDWPHRLYDKFTNINPAARFDSAVANNYNIGFLFASGPFVLKAGKHERFSLALAYGADLTELRSTVKTVQLIYNANYQFAVPPPMPTASAEAGDHFVRLSWDDVAERGRDPVTGVNDFEGYRIYRSTDPNFLDPKVITNGQGTDFFGNGKPIAQFDLKDGRYGYSSQNQDGVSYWLGNETGLTHTWTDTTVTDGQEYYYAVTSYDYGPRYAFRSDSLDFYPSENAIAVSRTPRGGVILPKNVVVVRPNPRASGFMGAVAGSATHVAGAGSGDVSLQVVNSSQVPDGHVLKILFQADSPESIRAQGYSLVDSTAGKVIFAHGLDLEGLGVGPVGAGLLPVIRTQELPTVDTAGTGFQPGNPTNARLQAVYQPGLSRNLRRIGYPDDISIVFSDSVVDTSQAAFPFRPLPARFQIWTTTDSGSATRLKFRFLDADHDGTMSKPPPNEYIDILTAAAGPGGPPGLQVTWRVQLDTLGQGERGPLRPPHSGDIFRLHLVQPLGAADAYRFVPSGERIDPAKAQKDFKQPYVVPNPYVGSASFEPARFAVSGRGERRLEFRAVPRSAVIRIYTVRGELVQTLRQDGSNDGFVPWNLRTKDNLDVAPGLYIFHVDGGTVGKFIGKFAIIK